MARLYDYRCNTCGSEREALRDIDKRRTHAPECCGEKMQIVILSAPMGFIDREVRYVCPVTNEKVTSRRQRNELMKRNNLMDANDFKGSIKKRMKQAKEDKEWMKQQEAAIPADLKRAQEKIVKDAEKQFKASLK